MVNGTSRKQVPGEGLSGQKQNFSWAVHKAFFSSAHRSLSETHTGNSALENTIEIQNPMLLAFQSIDTTKKENLSEF